MDGNDVVENKDMRKKKRRKVATYEKKNNRRKLDGNNVSKEGSKMRT